MYFVDNQHNNAGFYDGQIKAYKAVEMAELGYIRVHILLKSGETLDLAFTPEQASEFLEMMKWRYAPAD